VAVILIGAAYLVYVPNFLSVKNIDVQGVGGSEQAEIAAHVNDYFSHIPFYNPQRNLIFLSKEQLNNYLLLDSRVYKVTSIKKKLFKRTLAVSVELKRRQFVVQQPNGYYAVFNDGVVEERLDRDPALWLSADPGALKIKDGARAEVDVNIKYFSDRFLAQLDVIQKEFKNLAEQEIEFIEIPALVSAMPKPVETQPDSPSDEGSGTVIEQTTAKAKLPLDPEDLHIVVKKANYKGSAPTYRLIVDRNQDLREVFSKLHLLMMQTAMDRYRNLYYIDMRFEDKGFICLISAPCAREEAGVRVDPLEVSPIMPEVIKPPVEKEP
jgi:hypothetical protein